MASLGDVGGDACEYLEDWKLEAEPVTFFRPLDFIFIVAAGFLENGFFAFLEDLVDVFLFVKQGEYVSCIFSAIAYDE